MPSKKIFYENSKLNDLLSLNTTLSDPKTVIHLHSISETLDVLFYQNYFPKRVKVTSREFIPVVVKMQHDSLPWL